MDSNPEIPDSTFTKTHDAFSHMAFMTGIAYFHLAPQWHGIALNRLPF